MAYDSEVLNVQLYVEQVENLLYDLTSNAMTEQYYSNAIERVRDAQQVAVRCLNTIEDGSSPNVEEAIREAERVESKIREAQIDIRDCLAALEGN